MGAGCFVNVGGTTAVSPAPRADLRMSNCEADDNGGAGIVLAASHGDFAQFGSTGNFIQRAKVHHNAVGLAMDHISSSPAVSSLTTLVQNLLCYRNTGRGIALAKSGTSGTFAPRFSFLVSARNEAEGLFASGLAASTLIMENATIRKNYDGIAGTNMIDWDVGGIVTDFHLKWTNMSGPSPGLPDGCTWPFGWSSGPDPNSQNLACDPEFVDEAGDDYHLMPDQNPSKSLDTGRNAINPLLGTNPVRDFEGNSRVIDFGLDGPNGNFPNNWADRSCFEVPN